MNYNKLLEIASIYIDYSKITSFPVDSYYIATHQLNIRVKNSLQCKIDYKTSENPLMNNAAIYCIFKGEYTIYYDENNPYKNFYLAHEIAHHLLNHLSDDIDKHYDSNLLATIIISPPHLLKKYKIRNGFELAQQCKVPVEVAEIYWKEYCNYYLINRKINNKMVFLCVFSAFLAIFLVIVLLYMQNLKTLENDAISNEITTFMKSTETLKEITTNNAINSDVTKDTVVYVTKSGKKFHNANCQYIVDKNNITKLSKTQALEQGYTPCQICNE